MSTRRVVVTGLGVITSLGEAVDEMWEALCAGKSGIKPITRWVPTQFPVRFGGECTNFDITRYGLDKREAQRLDPFGPVGLAASMTAVTASFIPVTTEHSWHGRAGHRGGRGRWHSRHRVRDTSRRRGPANLTWAARRTQRDSTNPATHTTAPPVARW